MHRIPNQQSDRTRCWAACAGLLAFWGSILFCNPSAGAAVNETFSNNPVQNGRFSEQTAGTETVFTYQAQSQNIAAHLDVDRSTAFYLSAPFQTVTDLDTVSFSFLLRIEDVDDRVPPTAFLGLMTAQHVEDFGDGLTLNLATSLGKVVATASVDNSGYSKRGGIEIQLETKVEYAVFARYSAATRQFTIDIFGGEKFVKHVGQSVADWPADRTFSVNRLGIQNGGARQTDSDVGFLTMVVDDLFSPGHPPVSLSVSDISVKEGTGGGTEALFKVQLSLPSDVAAQVDYATIDGSARAGEDYTPITGVLVIPAGATSGTIKVPISPDSLGETNETFQLVLSKPVNANLANGNAQVTVVDDDTPRVSIAGLTVSEGNNGLVQALLPVTLSNPSSQNVSVRYATSDGTALAGSDYLGTNGIALFAPGTTHQVLTVWIKGDIVAEGNENLLVALGSPVNATLGAGVGPMTILDDDPAPTLSVSDDTIVEGDAGPRSVAITLRLSGPTAELVTVSFATSPGSATAGSATAGSDYLAKTGLVTFAPGETNKTVALTILGDTQPEEDETFDLVLSNPTHASLGEHTRGRATIVDDDRTATLSVEDAMVAEGPLDQTTNLVFDVHLSRPAPVQVTVNFATVGGTATAGVDFVSLSGVVTFPPGVSHQSIAVTVVGDEANEANELFYVRLDNPLNATLTKGEASGTIINDDGVSLSVSDASGLEGDIADVQAIFTVTLTGTPTQPVSVSFATRDRTATAGSDYAGASGVLRFQLGQSVQTVSVPVRGDLLNESSEVFEMNLSAAVGATIARAQGLGTIVDNDPPFITINNLQQLEGTGGPTTARFTVSLSSPSVDEVRINYTTVSGTATESKDFLHMSGTLVFPPGVSSLPLDVTILGDAIDEPDETFLVRLASPVGATLPANSQGVGTIRDDDDAPRISIGDAQVSECSGGTGSVSFTITLSAASERPVTVTFSTGDGSATAGADFDRESVTITFPPGTTSQEVSVALNCDLHDEPDEWFFGYLSGPVNGFIDDNVGRAVITDDDPPEISVNDLFVPEGDTGSKSAVVRMSVSSTSPDAITVDFTTTDGTAHEGVDYAHVSGTIQFAPGTTNATLNVPILGDTLPEGDETLHLVFSNPVGARLIRNEAVVRIVDDDLPVIQIADATVVEADSQAVTVSVFVRLSRSSPQTVGVSYATADNTARNGVDFVQSAGALTFAPGELSQEIRISVLGDLIVEGNETFWVNLSSPVSATLGRSQAQVTLVDNDGAPVLSVNEEEIGEGDAGPRNLVFSIRLSAPSAVPVSVGFATADGSARSGTDYLPKTGTIRFSPGVTNQIVTVTVLGDTLYESDEDFFLVLTNPLNTVLARTQARALIKNDDAPSILTVEDVSVLEGASGQKTNADFRIRLTPANALPVTVQYATRAGLATAGSDFEEVRGTLTFAPGQIEQQLRVVVIGDNETELDEPFVVSLTDPTNAQLGRAEGTGTILNDDGLALRISNASVAEPNTGEVAMTFTVTIAKPSTDTAQVRYATVDGNATAGIDYSPTSGLLTFPPGLTNQSLNVLVKGDLLDEPNETFLVRLSEPINATLGTAQGTGMILDNDPPSISINDVSVIASRADSVEAVFTVRLSSTTSDVVTVDVGTGNGTATAGTDYSEYFDVLRFAPGDLQRTFKLLVKGNTLDETNEFFFVNLSNLKNATPGDLQGVCTILNEGVANLPPRVILTSPIDGEVFLKDFSPIVIEAEASDPDGVVTQVSFQADAIRLGSVSAPPFRMSWSNAPAGTYTLTASAMDNIGASATSAPIRITVVSPRVNSPPLVALTHPAHGAIFRRSEVVPIEAQASDADGAVAKVEFFAGSTQLGEDTAVPFTVDWANAPLGSFWLTAVATDNEGAIRVSTPIEIAVTSPECTPANALVSGLNPGSNLPSGISSSAELYFAQDLSSYPPFGVNQVPRPAGVPRSQRAAAAFAARLPGVLRETFEAFPPGAEPAELAFGQNRIAVSGDASVVEVSEPAATIQGEFPISGTKGLELSGGTVRLNFGSPQAAFGFYATDVELNAATVTLINSAGNRREFALPVRLPQGSGGALFWGVIDQDDPFDRAEISNLGGSEDGFLVDDFLLAAPAQSIPGASWTTVSVENAAPLLEGNLGSVEANFVVTLSQPSAQVATVEYATVDGSAQSPRDYSAATGLLTFPPGQTQHTLRVPVVGDLYFENDEAFRMQLHNPTNALLGRCDATATILNDDSLPQLSIDDPTLSEGNSGRTPANFTIRLSAPSDREVSVDFATVDGTAIAPLDYEHASGTLAFHESSAGPSTAAASNPSAAKLSILRGGIGLALSWPGALTAYAVESIDQFTKTNVWASVPGAPTLVADQFQLTLNPDGAHRFYRLASSVLFGPGETSKTVAVPVVGDLINEPDETFVVTLSNPVNATLGKARGTATIQNDDGAPTVSINDLAILEGNSGTSGALFNVTLSGASSQMVTVSFATSDGTAQAPADYTETAGTLRFAPGETNKIISVAVIGDLITEPDETFVVALSNPVNCTLGKARGNAIIRDDDHANEPPTVWVTTPANGAVFFPGSDILLTAEAADADGSVVQVEFFDGATSLGILRQPPYSMLWMHVLELGAHTLTARATDDDGAIAVSSPVAITLNNAQADVAIIRNFQDPEIETIQDYLFELGLTYHVFDQEGLTFEVLQHFKLVIWDDLGAAVNGLRNADVALFQRTLDAQIPLYLIGQRLAASATDLTEPARSLWEQIVHLRPAQIEGGDGVVAVVTEGNHRVINGRFGYVQDFPYPAVIDQTTETGTDDVLLGHSGNADVLVAYQHPSTGVRSLTQNVLVQNGSDDAQSLAERRRLFLNGVWWLLRRPLCGLTDLAINQSAFPNPAAVGQPLTYTLILQRSGECEATGVVVTDVLPVGVKFISAQTPQGTWSEANGIVTFHLGLVEEVFLALEVTVVPTRPGALANSVQARCNEREQSLGNNSSILSIPAN